MYVCIQRPCHTCIEHTRVNAGKKTEEKVIGKKKLKPEAAKDLQDMPPSTYTAVSAILSNTYTEAFPDMSIYIHTYVHATRVGMFVFERPVIRTS
jgi:hypothetical protein